MSKSCSILLIVLCPIPSVTLKCLTKWKTAVVPHWGGLILLQPCKGSVWLAKGGQKIPAPFVLSMVGEKSRTTTQICRYPLGCPTEVAIHDCASPGGAGDHQWPWGAGIRAWATCTSEGFSSLEGCMETLLAWGKAAPRWLQACTMLMSGGDDSGCTQELVQEGTSHEQQCMVHEEPQWCTTTLQKAGPPFCPLKWLSGKDRVCGKDAQSNHWEGFQLLRENTSHSHPAPEQNISRQIAAVRE